MFRRFHIPLQTLTVPKKANRIKKSATSNRGEPVNLSQRYLISGWRRKAMATAA